MSTSIFKKQFNILILLIPGLLIILYFAFTDSDEVKAFKAAEDDIRKVERDAENKIIDLMFFGQSQIATQLKDGNSAKFANVYVSTDNIVCGEVNSKNSFGGYAGYQRFISAYPSNITTLEESSSERQFKKSWDKFCKFKITTAHAQSEHTL